MLKPRPLLITLFGFFFRSKTRPQPVRDVSTVAEPGKADHKQESITADGPLTVKHRRLALRDSRLLPKPKPDPSRRWSPKPPRQKHLTKEEASRLFGATLRTKNRDVMDLAADEAQLERYGLPVWTSECDIAAALDLPLKQLQAFSIHRKRERAPHYITFAIPKRGGGERIICAPKKRLKSVLRKLDQLLVQKLPKSDTPMAL